MNHGSLVTGNTLLVNFKKTHPDAITPTYSKYGDAALDLTAISINKFTSTYTEFETGIAVEIPEGYVGLVFPRSSQSNYTQILANNVGVIDSSFRGNITVRMRNTLNPFSSSTQPKEYNIGDRVAQLLIIPYPKIVLHEVQYLSTTERGEGSYGSTGK